jgi:hypothetical protein
MACSAAGSSLVRPSDRCRGLAGKDQCQGSAPLAGTRPWRALDGDLSRREDARREEDGPAALAGTVAIFVLAR